MATVSAARGDDRKRRTCAGGERIDEREVIIVALLSFSWASTAMR
jgi:hypothetical protein